MKNFRIIAFLILFLAIPGLILTSCKQKAGKTTEETVMNQLTPAEIEDGWVLLFDGKTTNGWRGYNKPAFPDTGWYVEDGTLHCIESGLGEAGLGGDIICDKKFKNFHLKLEWKIGKGGNSGIFYLAQEIEGWQIWKTAPEMQILDNERHLDAQLGKDGNRKAGSLYDLIPAVPQNADTALAWNAVEIMVYDGTVVHKMNGETVLEYHLWTDDWNKLIEDSKFPEINPDWGNVANEGYIGLQDHGHDVWFRNIKIKEL
jgi:hypothetical protein